MLVVLERVGGGGGGGVCVCGSIGYLTGMGAAKER